MNNKAILHFCKQVGRKLRCAPVTKHVLLQGLADELSELPGTDQASLESLEAKVGSVSQVAAELQTLVPSEEVNHTVQKNRRKVTLIIGGVLVLALVLLFGAIILFLNGPFYVVETIIQEG